MLASVVVLLWQAWRRERCACCANGAAVGRQAWGGAHAWCATWRSQVLARQGEELVESGLLERFRRDMGDLLRRLRGHPARILWRAYSPAHFGGELGSFVQEKPAQGREREDQASPTTLHTPGSQQNSGGVRRTGGCRHASLH